MLLFATYLPLIAIIIGIHCRIAAIRNDRRFFDQLFQLQMKYIFRMLLNITLSVSL